MKNKVCRAYAIFLVWVDDNVSHPLWDCLGEGWYDVIFYNYCQYAWKWYFKYVDGWDD